MLVEILIVDDEELIQDLIKSRYRKEIRSGEFVFHFALNGIQALEILDQEPNINIILCDINMPQMDGLTLLAKFKEKQRVLRTIMVTAYGNMQNIRAAMNQGAFDFVTKPIDYKDLKTTILKANEELVLIKEGEAAKKQLPITQKELEKTDKKARYLEELDELKSRFFTNISHEFRTPLTVIRGMADQIRENPERWSDKGSLMIRRNSDQLIDLVNQILDLQKLESGKLQLHLVQSDMIGFTRYLSESFSSLAESKGVILSFYSEEAELWMDFDPEKVLRIYTNLLSNAIKFTPKGGKINIKVYKEEEGQTYNVITVEDTGIGIPEKQLPHIFDRFYQVYDVDSITDNAVVEVGEGSGIGLALIKELVQLMQGKIEVESSIGKGSKFTLKIPISNNASKETTKILDHSAIPANFEKSSNANQAIDIKSANEENLPILLIIEDNPDVTEYLISCLEGQYHLLTARDGQEGIDVALDQIPDLIISDVMMPKKDGFEVCQTLKNDERTSHIPIVLLTAKSDQDSRIQGLKRGADAYLAKPFHKDELTVRLEMLLEIRRKLQLRYKTNTDSETLQESEEEEYEDQFFYKVYKVLDDNITNFELNVPKLCSLVGMSRSSLHRKVKALTGDSITLFVRNYRFKKATKLLKTTDLPISEVAFLVGFSDPAHFSRLFKKEFGLSAREIRKQGKV